MEMTSSLPVKKKRWLKNSLIILIVLLAAFGVALYQDSRFSMLKAKPVSAVIQDVEYVNYTFDGERYVSASEDPQIIINNINGSISGITVRLTAPLEEDCRVQVFYTTAGSTFSEKKSGFYTVQKGSTILELPREGVTSSIRIDIGNSTGIKVKVDTVTVNPSKPRRMVLTDILSSARFWVQFELLLVAFAFLGLHGIVGAKKLYGFLFRYRWCVGICLIIFLTLNKIHGDSMYMYDTYVQPGLGSEFSEPLFGQARSIRSDEWVSNNPRVFSSRFLEDPFGKYNDIARAADTVNPVHVGIDNLGNLGYSAFTIFYRLFGIEYGFCFEWTATFILTFLFSFEFFLILTKKKKLLSLLGASLIAFSSFHLWWARPSFLLFIHAAIVFFYYFFTTENKKIKYLCAIGEPVAAANFITIFYPAWQVPVAYVLLVFLVWIFHENWDAVKGQKKADWLLFGTALAACIALVVTYVYSIAGRLEGLMTTVYPGARVSLGGGGSGKLFYYVQTFLYPFKDVGNPSEGGTFCSLFPLPFLIGIVYTVKTRGKNWLANGLIAVGLVLTVYVYVGFPLWLSKLLLLTYSTSERAMDVISLISVYLLIILLSEKDKLQWSIKWPIALGISGLTVFGSVYVCKKYFPGYMSTIYVVGIFVLLTLFGMCLLIKCKKHAVNGVYVVLIIVCVGSGLCVRPIQRGFDAIDSKPAAKEIRSVNEADPGQKWIAVSQTAPLSAYSIACGSATINSINDYPNLELWNKLDPEKQYNDIYNRYAHVNVEFCDEDTSFELIQPDWMRLRLSYKDMKLTEVQYVLSDSVLEVDNQYVYFDELYNEAGIYIYQVHYKG